MRVFLFMLLLVPLLAHAQNAMRWEEPLKDQGAVLEPGTILDDAAVSVAGTEWDGSTNLDMLGWFELTTNDANDLFSSPVTASGATIDLYRVVAADGTNYENTPVTADIDEFPHLFIGAFPIATETGNRPIVIGPFLVPPIVQKYLLHNQTGQTMKDTYQLNLYTNNPELQ